MGAAGFSWRTDMSNGVAGATKSGGTKVSERRDGGMRLTQFWMKLSSEKVGLLLGSRRGGREWSGLRLYRPGGTPVVCVAAAFGSASAATASASDFDSVDETSLMDLWILLMMR